MSETSLVPVDPALQNENAALHAQINELEGDLEDLRMLHETILEHGSSLENELIDLVETLNRVAKDLEQGEFNPQTLNSLVTRPDELGELGRVFLTMGREVSARERRLRLLRVVIPAGVAMSAMRDFNRLLETMVVEGQRLYNADAGSLFLLNDEKKLEAVIARCDSLKISEGGTSGNPSTIPTIPLFDEQGRENQSDPAARAALEHHQVNIPDVYQVESCAASAVVNFDQRTGYHSRSLLALPLEGEGHEVVGVLQLLNARDHQTGEPVDFIIDDVITTLVMLASAALANYKREESLRKEITKLRIEIDTTKRDTQVSEITESEYFQNLQQRAKNLRKKH